MASEVSRPPILYHRFRIALVSVCNFWTGKAPLHGCDEHPEGTGNGLIYVVDMEPSLSTPRRRSRRVREPKVDISAD